MKKISKKWNDVCKVRPEADQPCEYTIEIKCYGWYRPTETEVRFAGDERLPPLATIKKWRVWKEGEEWALGQRLVREHRQQQELINQQDKK